MSRPQDWFMMTGDLIINLTNTKSTDIYNSRNFKFKTTSNLMSNSNHSQNENSVQSVQKQCNSSPASLTDDDNNGVTELSDINSHNNKHTQTNNNYNQTKRQMSLPIVNQVIDTTVMDNNDTDLTLTNSNNNSEEEVLSSQNSSTSESATLSSTNVSPTKTMTTINTTQEQTESSMSENYSGISSLSCQTLDQNHRNPHVVHHNETLSISSASDQSTTASTDTSPDDQLSKRTNLDDDEESKSNTIENVSYRQLDECGENLKQAVNINRSPIITTQRNEIVESVSQTPTTAQNTVSSSDEESSDLESLHSFHYSPPKGVDTPSASRLAKRLYNLEGFKKSDVSRHLSKNNEFNCVVAEEYLKYFDFTSDTLDVALRKFLSRFCLIGETQERERVLVHFSKRYLDCNPGSFKSNDAIHTLTCALMLLNTDLHAENIGRKMTCTEFIQNLSDLNEGEDFPRDILRQLFQGIKLSPLEWSADEDDNTNENEATHSEHNLMSANLSQQINLIGHNPFLEVPNPNCATEYKKGYIMRKCCYESNGKRTPIGKRGWKMFYATLRDLVLYLHKDEQGFRKNQLYESLNNSIRIHHSLATIANDYTKKDFVFRLITADYAEYLFQTSDARELQVWIDTINLVSASLSSPPLPGAVGSYAKKFQRPLLPVSHTKLNLREQLSDQENRVSRLQMELEDHLIKAPEKGAQKRVMNEYAEKESFLQHELKRYRTYVSLLKSKLTQYSITNSVNVNQTQPLLKVAIGEETSDDASDTPIIIPVKRNYTSERYSYKQALLNNSSSVHKKIK